MVMAPRSISFVLLVSRCPFGIGVGASLPPSRALPASTAAPRRPQFHPHTPALAPMGSCVSCARRDDATEECRARVTNDERRRAAEGRTTATSAPPKATNDAERSTMHSTPALPVHTRSLDEIHAEERARSVCTRTPPVIDLNEPAECAERDDGQRGPRHNRGSEATHPRMHATHIMMLMLHMSVRVTR
jgi:hypothetical protein